MASSSIDPGVDWGLEGTPQWWWKYVMPNPASFYSHVLEQLAATREAESAGWLQHATGEVLEGLTMFHAATRMGDREGGIRLKSEAFARLAKAVNNLGSEAGFVGIDQVGPIGPRTHGAAEVRIAG